MYSILWDYRVGMALKWLLIIKLSATENDYMSYYHLFDFLFGLRQTLLPKYSSNYKNWTVTVSLQLTGTEGILGVHWQYQRSA